MIHLFSRSLAALSFALAPAFADTSGDMDRLLEAMGVGGIIEIMRKEGLAYGQELVADAASSGGSAAWDAAMDRIYDVDRMSATVTAEFQRVFGDADPSPLLTFFESEGGRQLVALELSARRAMTDEAVEDAARDAYTSAAAEEATARMAQLDAFVEANDLIEANVVGALNSNILFYSGLVDGGAAQLTDDQILRDVWQQEEETREDTREWVYGFLLMAYKPLPDEVLDDYIELSKTPAGEALNRALFGGFDKMYGEISYALGLALAREMQVQDL